MPAPVYNNISGICSTAAGTGSYTPTGAANGASAWSTVPAGWFGLVRYDDVGGWELRYTYWNGTTLNRLTNAFVNSSTGSALTLTAAATASMIADADEIMSHIGDTPWAAWVPQAGVNAITAIGTAAPTVTGTGGAAALANTNYLTRQRRILSTSATTASAQAAWAVTTGAVIASSTAAGGGGYEFTARFGASGLPTGPRLFVGLTSVTAVAATEGSALAASIAAFNKDSTDTNIQLLTKNGTTANKIDTGIPLVANSWYSACVWAEPGSLKVYGLLIRMDTGDIWFGSTTTNTPVDGALMFPQIAGGLNATNTGTAIVMHMGAMALRGGF